MKNTRTLLALLLCGMATTATAQERTVIKMEERSGDSVKTTSVTVATDTTVKRPKKHLIVSIGTGGVYVGRDRNRDSVMGPDSVKVPKPEARFTTQWGMLDLGFNRLNDHTSAADLSAAGINAAQHDEVFKLKEGKSVNVNVWVMAGKLRLSATPRQKWYVTTGLGLQIYNFRFDNPYQYTSASPLYPTHLDPKYNSYSKNKLGITYASIPLGLLGKTRLSKSYQLVYGGGVMGGYRIASWTKLKSEQFGKEKNHDAFNFRDFNACVYVEIGLDSRLRLYGTYQLTPLNKSLIDQQPYAIGFRFFGL